VIENFYANEREGRTLQDWRYSLPPGSDEYSKLKINQMGQLYQDILMRPLLYASLEQSLELTIIPRMIKNTTIYVDLKSKAEAAPEILEARISYRYYKFRYPQLISSMPNEPPDDDQFLYYDEDSIHYKDLLPYDDLITNFIVDKEKWPPGIQMPDGRVIASMQELKENYGQSQQKNPGALNEFEKSNVGS